MIQFRRGRRTSGPGLGTDSHLAVQGEAHQAHSRAAFEERAFDGFRAYYEFVPKGSLTVEYTVRLNQSGRFNLPPTRVEALYAPEMFGELPNDVVEVQSMIRRPWPVVLACIVCAGGGALWTLSHEADVALPSIIGGPWRRFVLQTAACWTDMATSCMNGGSIFRYGV